MNTKKPDLAYLGPKGTFSELISKKHYGASHNLVPLPTIDEIFDYVASDNQRIGVVPIENSSGGMIHATVDRLISDKNVLHINSELSVKVNLALASRKDTTVLEKIYSHFAPFHHCDVWLKEKYPRVKRVDVSSTSDAASRAGSEKNSAALCTREAAVENGLEILNYPVMSEIENVTQFYCIGHSINGNVIAERYKTSIVMTLANRPGALIEFLCPFKDYGVNLSRILSRPLIGKPQEYVFLVDMEGSESDTGVKNALDCVTKSNMCTKLCILGSYPIADTVES